MNIFSHAFVEVHNMSAACSTAVKLGGDWQLIVASREKPIP